MGGSERPGHEYHRYWLTSSVPTQTFEDGYGFVFGSWTIWLFLDDFQSLTIVDMVTNLLLTWQWRLYNDSHKTTWSLIWFISYVRKRVIYGQVSISLAVQDQDSNKCQYSSTSVTMSRLTLTSFSSLIWLISMVSCRRESSGHTIIIGPGGDGDGGGGGGDGDDFSRRDGPSLGPAEHRASQFANYVDDFNKR